MVKLLVAFFLRLIPSESVDHSYPFLDVPSFEGAKFAKLRVKEACLAPQAKTEAWPRSFGQGSGYRVGFPKTWSFQRVMSPVRGFQWSLFECDDLLLLPHLNCIL